jgi:hypothetical protein
MRAVLCESFEGIGALRFAETAEPRPADDEVMIDVHAASVSYMDYLMVCDRSRARRTTGHEPKPDLRRTSSTAKVRPKLPHDANERGAHKFDVSCCKD